MTHFTENSAPSLVPFWLQLLIATGIVLGAAWFYFSSKRSEADPAATRALASHMLRFARTFAVINLLANVIHAVTQVRPPGQDDAFLGAFVLGSVISTALNAAVAALVALGGTGLFVWLSRRGSTSHVDGA